MDPNETLRALRAEAHELLFGDKPDPERMGELFDALDGWITNGGFLPADWTRKA